MMATNILLVAITITIIIVEEKSGDSYIVVRTAIGKVMIVSACNVLIRTSVVFSDTGGSSGSGKSIIVSACASSGYGVGLLSLKSGA